MSTDMMGSVQDAAKHNIDRTVSSLKQGVEQTQATARDGMSKAVRTAEELAAFAQGNMEALARSSQIVAAGMQDMGQTLAAAARTSLDDMMGAFKAMASAKSVKDAMALQSSLLRASLDRAASHAIQMTEGGMKLSEQACAPITARLSLAAETFSRLG